MEFLMTRRTLILLIIVISFTASVFTQETLKVTTLLEKPYMMKRTLPDGNVTYEGYIKDIMDKIASMNNFKFEFEEVPDNVFGIYSNKTWTGLIGVLVRGEADLAAAPLTVTETRARFVDFSTPFQTSGPVLIMHKPTEEQVPIKERLTKLLTPFEFSVWLLAVVAFMVTSTIIYMISYINPYEWRRMAHDGEATLREMESFTCLNSFWFAISAMAWQGYTRSPRSMGGRIVVTFWWLFVIIFISCYLATLTNMLKDGPKHSVMQKYSPIQSLSDLSEQSEVKPMVVKESATYQFFKQSRQTYLSKIYEQLSLDSKLWVKDISHGLDIMNKAREGEAYAFITESTFARYVTKRNCEFYTVNDFIVNRYYSLAFPINSTLRTNFDLAILELQGSGFLNLLEERWFKGNCDNYILDTSRGSRIKVEPFYQLDLGSFSGALFILAVGLVFGSLVTVIEILLYKFAESVPETPHPVRSVDAVKDPEATDTLISPGNETEKSGTTV